MYVDVWLCVVLCHVLGEDHIVHMMRVCACVMHVSVSVSSHVLLHIDFRSRIRRLCVTMVCSTLPMHAPCLMAPLPRSLSLLSLALGLSPLSLSSLSLPPTHTQTSMSTRTHAVPVAPYTKYRQEEKTADGGEEYAQEEQEEYDDEQHEDVDQHEKHQQEEKDTQHEMEHEHIHSETHEINIESTTAPGEQMQHVCTCSYVVFVYYVV